MTKPEQTTVAGLRADGVAHDQDLGRGKHLVGKGKESGQSLVEFALVLPIILMVLLGVANLGLGIRAQLQLAQVTQEAAQYLVHHPSWADPDTPLTNPPTYSKLVTYMNSLSSYQLTPLEVHLTVGSSTVFTSTVQQDTITVNYPFPVVFPMVGKLSVGSLHGGTMNLGAAASTIAETHPPNAPTFNGPNPCVMIAANANNCPDFTASTHLGWVELLWQPPVEAPFVPVDYCIERQYGTEDDLYYADSTSNFPAINNLHCVAAKQSIDPSHDLYFIDDNGGAGYMTTPPLYSVRTIQHNGLTSASLTVNP